MCQESGVLAEIEALDVPKILEGISKLNFESPKFETLPKVIYKYWVIG